jgi:hypothetical protein
MMPAFAERWRGANASSAAERERAAIEMAPDTTGSGGDPGPEIERMREAYGRERFRAGASP